ncbi:hypothetical protein ABT097_30205, partial [Streptomyces sp. NPDC002225]
MRVSRLLAPGRKQPSGHRGMGTGAPRPATGPADAGGGRAAAPGCVRRIRAGSPRSGSAGEYAHPGTTVLDGQRTEIGGRVFGFV